MTDSQSELDTIDEIISGLLASYGSYMRDSRSVDPFELEKEAKQALTELISLEFKKGFDAGFSSGLDKGMRASTILETNDTRVAKALGQLPNAPTTLNKKRA